MIKNYIKTAFRSLVKNKGYSFLNIFGLAIGIACAALIFLWVEDEVNFDSQNVKKERIYIARENQQYDTKVFTHSSTPGPLGPAMLADFPAIANTCRASEGTRQLLFTNGDNSVFASGKYIEASVFSMFTLPFVQGNAATAFAQLHSVVITESAAKKFFGNNAGNLIGKTIRVDNKQDYTVSGVLKDLPANATLQFEWLMPFKIYWDQNQSLQFWGNNSVSTYVELKPGANASSLDKQLAHYIEKHQKGATSQVFLFGMNDWHLYNEFIDGKKTGGGQIQYVHLFTVIAWIILFIACINFMNLATARSEKRAREVGVRKVLGAGKKLLILQFMGEALFMAFVAAIAAVILIIIALPIFNTIVQKQLTVGFINTYHIPALILITLVCGIIAGSYPSLYLSSFNPASVLKGLKLKDSGAALIRKGLVVMQFTVSIVLIISTVIVYQQIQHIKSRQLGFNKDNLVEMPLQGQMGINFNSIKQDLLNTGDIENVALSDHSTITGGNNTSGFNWDGKPAGSSVLISRRNITPGFFATSGIKIIEGRDLTETDTTLQGGVVITQSLEKLMGNSSAIGKIIRNDGNQTATPVVGVVNDYVYGDMYGKSDPVVFGAVPRQYASVMYVKIKPQNSIEKAIADMQAVMKKDNPSYPFDYKFVDEQFNQFFLSEMLVSKLSSIFASLAIIISCLGLFGLAAYTAEKRIKEIGIRKVLGASVSGITGLLSKDFLQLVVLSCLLAFPLAYWEMHNWLKHYEYHIDIQWWVFLAAGVAAVFIALATISFQSVKAAIANPVKSLRSE